MFDSWRLTSRPSLEELLGQASNDIHDADELLRPIGPPPPLKRAKGEVFY